MNVIITITLELSDDGDVHAGINVKPMLPLMPVAGVLRGIAEQIESGDVDTLRIKEVSDE